MAVADARQQAVNEHLERGLAHVRAAQETLGAPALGARSRSARAWRELNAAASQFETVAQLLDGRLPVPEGELAEVVALPAARSAVSEQHRLVADRRVIVNLGYGDAFAVLGAIEASLMDVLLKRSARERLERVRAVLTPRVARARRVAA